MKRIILFFSLFSLFAISSCKKDDGYKGSYDHYFEFSPGMEDDIALELTRIESSTEIYLKAGTYNFQHLSILNPVSEVYIHGEGMDKTVLDFSTQSQAGEGLLISDVDKLIIKDIKLLNSKGDLLKVKSGIDIQIVNVHAEWEGAPSSTNGGYALYPVQCQDVLMDGCYVRGASDAGVYVGQTTNATVKNCEVTECVAGIEIENCRDVVAFGNECYNNAAGFLVFDLPGLSQYTDNVKVYNNNLHDNNHVNFAPSNTSANAVNNVPPGTGLMILAATNVECYGNTIKDNNSLPIGIINYILLDNNYFNHPAPGYNIWPENVKIHDNIISKQDAMTPNTNAHEFLMALDLMQTQMQAADPTHTTMDKILYTFLASPSDVGANPRNICIKESDDTFLSVHADDIFNLSLYSHDVTPYVCP